MSHFIGQTGNDVKTAMAGSLWQMAAGLLHEAGRRHGAAARAHERRRASAEVGVDTMSDTGLCPETASGVQAWQADLPFFMQSGFGRR